MRAAGHRAHGGLPGVEHLPRPADLGQHPQAVRVGEVDERLEGRAGLQQDAAQPVLVPRRAGDEVVPLRRHGARRVEDGVRARDGQERVGYADRRLGDHERVPLVGLGVAGEEPGGAVHRRPGQVGALEPRHRGSLERERPDVADLVDHNEGVARYPGEELVEVALPVRHRGVQRDFPLGGHEAGPVGPLPDVDPEHGPGARSRFHDGILQIVDRSEPALATPTLPGRGLAPGSFLSVVRNGDRLRWQHPPGPLRGRGRRPSGGDRSAAPRGCFHSKATSRLGHPNRDAAENCNGRFPYADLLCPARRLPLRMARASGGPAVRFRRHPAAGEEPGRRREGGGQKGYRRGGVIARLR